MRIYSAVTVIDRFPQQLNFGNLIHMTFRKLV